MAQASRAVLFYGSCLREKQLDGLMLDFYLIVSDYRAAYAKALARRANRLIPPNVFYFEHDGLVAKYAVLSEADFARLARTGDEQRLGLGALRPALAAGLGGGRGARERAIDAVARAAPTLLAAARRQSRRGAADLLATSLRTHLFGASCAPSGRDAAASVVDLDPERYRAASPSPRSKHARSMAAAREAGPGARIEGKALSVARLAKASLTFAGGADYIAWKINRHAGTDIQLKPWQRRHPLLAGISLLPRLLKSGAVR